MLYQRNDKNKKQYYEKLNNQLHKLKKKHRTIAELILQDTAGYYLGDEQSNRIAQILWNQDTKHIREIFSGDEFCILEFLLGKEHAVIFKSIWDQSTIYPFSQGYLRRSFRTDEDSVVHIHKNIERLYYSINFVAEGYSWNPEILFSNMADYSFLHDYIAYELDRGNTALMERFRDIIYGDNQNGILTRNIIKGMLMSRLPEAHRMIGELLKAAKLQEGLRQSIVESMDETSREAFIYLLNIIIEDQMWRFSSIIRAFDVWTGLPIDAMKTSAIKKCIIAAYDCLTNPNVRNKYLISEDTQLLYVALWSTAFDELVRTKEEILSIAKSAPTYRKIVALQFLLQCQAPGFQHETAVHFMNDTDLEVVGLAIPNLHTHMASYQMRYSHKTRPSYDQQASPEDWKLFNQLRDILDRITGKEIKFKSNGLMASKLLTADSVCERMLVISYISGDLAMCDILLDYRNKMLPDTRTILVFLGLNQPKTPKQRQTLFHMLGDKGTEVRRTAFGIADNLKISKEEFIEIEELLQYKAGDIRKAAIILLFKQNHQQLLASISRLLKDKKVEKRLGGLDLLLHIKKQDESPIYKKCEQIVKNMTEPSPQEKVLIEQIIGSEAKQYEPENGYGLYNPNQQVILHELKQPTRSPLRNRWFNKKASSSQFGLDAILSTNQTDLQKILDEWNNEIDQYRDYEYEVEFYDGRRENRVLGTLEWGMLPFVYKQRDKERDSLDNYPLADVWRTLARKQDLNVHRILGLLYYFETNGHMYFEISLEKFLSHYPISSVKKWFNSTANEQFDDFIKQLPYRAIIRSLFKLLLDECDQEDIYKCIFYAASDVYESFKSTIVKHHKPLTMQEVNFPDPNEHNMFRNDEVRFPDIINTAEIKFWIEKLKETYVINDTCFEEGFTLLYRFARINEWKSNNILDLLAYSRALHMGIINENEMYIELMARPAGVNHIQSIHQDRVNKEIQKFPKAVRLVESVVQRVIEIELKRGDSDTTVSRLARNISKYEGMRHMVHCLLSLGNKDSLSRGYLYSWGSTTKKGMISHLLKNCHPSEGEDADKLTHLLQEHNISDKRLIDVAMYAPQWVRIIEEYLKWPGLSSACWYFHAHVNEVFSNEKETMVARYSPISPSDLNEGAFDINWFLDFYHTIGEERFGMVYESAKYISEGANHRRSQLFSDAVLGRIEEKKIEQDLSSKRNKNHVLCYGLIPLPEKQRDSALIHRYEVLQQFAKESKQFGSQRRDSEAKAVRIGLENLARSAGFSDVIRMIWKVEAEQFKLIAAYLEPTTIDKWQVALAIDELGKVSMHITKDGKKLKSVPSQLKKNDTVLMLQQYKTALKDQYKRSRTALEKAMVMEDPFTVDEIYSMQENLVIAPLVRSLVFKSSHTLGCFVDGGLHSPDGQRAVLEKTDEIFIAHPVHLYANGQWLNYQKDFVSRKVVQPFKQVFRELYLLNEDEQLEGTTSSRYAGHQIQPRKAASLFKTREWMVSYEEGLQKVFHKHNIIATMYAMADWFSPADIESPTIEKVAFYNRQSGELIHLNKLPPIIFSEVMRDIDLVVSVAHVGGVDPEASLSTIEIRSALVRELLPILKLSNAVIKGSHVHIAGTLGEYTVHLGSGVVHRMAAGMLHIIPIHSQHRGRLFLPFVDDDPRTAEVISKVILLAEDRKIKDPTILSQL